MNLKLLFFQNPYNIKIKQQVFFSMTHFIFSCAKLTVNLCIEELFTLLCMVAIHAFNPT